MLLELGLPQVHLPGCFPHDVDKTFTKKENGCWGLSGVVEKGIPLFMEINSTVKWL